MGRPPSTKPTSFDIAYLAGVSQPTVSRALRGSKSVSAATRANIERIARELGYSIESSVAARRARRTCTLALLFLADPAPGNASRDAFDPALLVSVARHCALRGHDLLVAFQPMRGDWHIAYQDDRRCDGLILVPAGDGPIDRTRFEHLAETDTPVVTWEPADESASGERLVDDLLRRIDGKAVDRRRPRPV